MLEYLSMSLERAREAARMAKAIGRYAVFHRDRKTLQHDVMDIRGEAIVLNTPREHPPYYWNYLEKKTTEKKPDGTRKYRPVLIGPHKAHNGAFPLIEEADEMMHRINPLLSPDQQYKGTLLLVAESLAKGKQGDDLQRFFEMAKPTFQRLNTRVIGVTTENDQNERGMQSNLRQVIEMVDAAVAQGEIVAYFPEGRTEGGKQKPGGQPGEINGMIEFPSATIKLVSNAIKRTGEIPLYIYVGITGDNQVWDPNSKKVATPAIQKAMYLHPKPLMYSVVDYPTGADEIEEGLHHIYGKKIPQQAVNRYHGERLAQLIPPHERGVYADPKLLDTVQVLRRNTHGMF